MKRELRNAIKKTVSGGKKAIATILDCTSRSSIGKFIASWMLVAHTAEYKPTSIVMVIIAPVRYILPARLRNNAPTSIQQATPKMVSCK
jgi:hypothetical protein